MIDPVDSTTIAGGAAGAANRVAVAIRQRIVKGALKPGERLPEERVRAELEVSRSSLREGLQLLIRERLVVHRLSRGFFIRELSRADISDLFQARILIECGALRHTTVLPATGLATLTRIVACGRTAITEVNWPEAAAASIEFHQALVALAGSPRLSGIANQVLTEFRLSYAYMNDPFAFHKPFATRNEEIAQLVKEGALDIAALALESYLRDSEDALLATYPEQARAAH